MVICYHDNDDLHGRVHVRNFLLQDRQREDGQHVGYRPWKDIVHEVASENAETKSDIFQIDLKKPNETKQNKIYHIPVGLKVKVYIYSKLDFYLHIILVKMGVFKTGHRFLCS